MPVFARAKLLIEDTCMSYRPRLEFNYVGPNPHKAYPKLLNVIIKNIAVPRENIQEKSFRWDREKPVETFNASFEIVKDFDRFTYMELDIGINGVVKPSKDFEKEGSVSINMIGYVRSEYPQDTMWERSFVYEMLRAIWYNVFYRDKRRRYVEQCRDWMLTIQNEMKSFFNLLPKRGE